MSELTDLYMDFNQFLDTSLTEYANGGEINESNFEPLLRWFSDKNASEPDEILDAESNLVDLTSESGPESDDDVIFDETFFDLTNAGCVYVDLTEIDDDEATPNVSR